MCQVPPLCAKASVRHRGAAERANAAPILLLMRAKEAPRCRRQVTTRQAPKPSERAMQGRVGCDVVLYHLRCAPYLRKRCTLPAGEWNMLFGRTLRNARAQMNLFFLFRQWDRRFLRCARNDLCVQSVFCCRQATSILFTWVTATNVLRRVVCRLAGDLTLVRQTIQVKCRGRHRAPYFGRCLFHSRANYGTAGQGSARRFLHLKERETGAIFGPQAGDLRVFIRDRSIRLTVRRRTFAASYSVINERRRLRIALCLTLVCGLLTASDSFAFCLINVRLNGLIYLRLVRNL